MRLLLARNVRLVRGERFAVLPPALESDRRHFHGALFHVVPDFSTPTIKAEARIFSYLCSYFAIVAFFTYSVAQISLDRKFLAFFHSTTREPEKGRKHE